MTNQKTADFADLALRQWQALRELSPDDRMAIEPVYHTLGKKLDEPPRRLLPPGECAYCDAHRGDQMMPSHTPSARCESGKRPHCTCSTCF